MNGDRAPTRHSLAHFILTLAGVTGTAGIFLPFTLDMSPLKVIIFWFPEWVSVLALPACLAILATIGAMRWLVSGYLSLAEKIIAYFTAALMMLASLSIWLGLRGVWNAPETWVIFSVQVFTLALGIGALIWCRRVSWSKQFSPVMAIQVVYLAHAAMMLTESFGDWEIGAYFVLVATLAFTAQIVLVLVEAARRPVTTPAR